MLHQQLKRDGLFLTTEQRRTICELYKENLPVKEICGRFKVSLQALTRVLSEQRIEPRKTENAHKTVKAIRKRKQWNKKEITPEVQKKILRLQKRGVPVMEISRTVGLSRGVVTRFIRGKE